MNASGTYNFSEAKSQSRLSHFTALPSPHAQWRYKRSQTPFFGAYSHLRFLRHGNSNAYAPTPRRMACKRSWVNWRSPSTRALHQTPPKRDCQSTIRPRTRSRDERNCRRAGMPINGFTTSIYSRASDISSARPDITAAPTTPINHSVPPIQRHESTYPVLSHFLASSRRTNRPSRPI